MRFEILGTLEVVGEQGGIELGATKERLVLGLLVAAANTVVSVERLADEIWGGEPPESAVASLRVYVSRLRKALGESDRILTRPTGYSLRVEADECDAMVFLGLLERGRDELAGGKPADAAATLRSALDLWRGPALADVCDLPLARSEAVRLEEARLEAVETRIEAELACGRHSALVGELEGLVGTHPLREQLWAFRMIALYRSGRQADALRAYQELRRTLGDELGIDPSPSLRELEDRILRQELPGPAVPEAPARPAALGPSAQTPVAALGAEPAPAAPELPAPAAPAPVPGGIVTLLASEVIGPDGGTAPEAAQRRHLALFQDAAALGGGTVRSMGDGLLAVFGSAAHALRAATAVQQAAGRESRRTGAPRLDLRMGLHVSDPLLDEGDYFGSAVTTVRRLCRRAAPGQVLSSAVVRDLAGRGAGLTFGPTQELVIAEGPLGPEPLAVVELQWPAFEPEVPLPAVLASTTGPFVGRRREWSVLEDSWETVASGAGLALVIRGEPGIGKSMLMAEFSRHCHRQGATILYGRCDEDGLVPYQPLVEALRHLAHAATPDRLAGHVGWGGAELSRLVPETERLGGVALERPYDGPADPEADRFRLFEAVADLLASMAADAPVVLAIEDVHWSDRSTELMLRHLARRGARLPFLLVMTVQDDALHHPGITPLLSELGQDPGLVELRLSGLEPAEVAEWLEAVTGAPLEPDGRRMARDLHQTTEGNPLYIREILRHLSEVGALVRRGERTVFGRSLDEVGLPDGIREVVDRRLSRMSEAVNQVLVLAAVIGPVFEELVLRRVGRDMDTETLFTAIDDALRARIITALPGEPARYVFTHNLVRRTLYERISAARRALVHRRAAEALELVHAADPDSCLGQVAFHLAAGARDGDAGRIVEYALRAGDRAMGQFAYDEAAGHYRTAAEAAARAANATGPGGAGRRTDELEAWLRLGEANWRAGDVTAARNAYGNAAELSRRIGDAEGFARAALGFAFETVGFSGITAGREQMEIIEEALARLPVTDSPIRARLLATLASILIYNEPARRIELAAQAVEMAERLGNPDTRILARLYTLAGNGPDLPLDRQLDLADEMLALAEAQADPAAIIAALFIRRSRLIWVGQWEAAELVSRRTARLAEELHADVHRIRPLLHESMTALLQGRLEDAKASTGHALDLINKCGSEWLLVTAGGQLLFCDFLRGGDLIPLLGSVEALAGEEYANLPQLRAGLAYGYAMAGQIDKARAILAEYGVTGFTSVPRTDEWWFCLWMLGQAAAMSDDRDSAAVLYDLMLPYAGILVCDGAACVCLGSMQLTLGMLAACMGRLDDALEHLEDADRRNERIGARPFLAWSAYEQARVLALRQGAGDREAATRKLGAALREAEEIGLDRLAGLASELQDELTPGAGEPPATGSDTIWVLGSLGGGHRPPKPVGPLS